MSKLTTVVDRVKSVAGMLAVWDEVREQVKEQAPELFGLLDALARDDYEGAARELLNWGTVVEAVADVLKRVDEVLPEEKIIALMERLGLPREA